MVCTAKDLLEWKDFPKGLRVLLLEKDVNYAAEIRSKLEEMDYMVSVFCNADEALSVVLSKSKAFHVAIVEVNAIDCDGDFMFLQMAKGLPTIMTASIQCLTTTMMKCITLGAIEVLNKPISEEKLRNIWQHVVHKAYNAGESIAAESPRLVKEPMIRMVKDEEELNDELLEDLPFMSDDHCDNEQDHSSGNDKYPAPSTPQLKQVRLLDDGSCHDQTNCSTEKDSASGERCEESKSVETSCCNAVPVMPTDADQPMHENIVKEENDSADSCKSESDTSPHHKNRPETDSHGGSTQIKTKPSETRSPCGARTNRKKMKVDWTSDLHRKFVQAVEQLGVEQAIPSRILELMKVEGLTRHNVASHLQKYRMHQRHALPKREERRISVRTKDTTQNSYYYQNMPIMAYPAPYHSNQTHLVANQAAYPMWVQPGSHTASLQAWGPPGPSFQTWPWKSYTAMQAEAWGSPVMAPLHGSYSCGSYPYYPQNVSGIHGVPCDSGPSMLPISHYDHHLADEVVDKIVKEAISKPWLPLPLGLKPPSTESVLSELSKQGISNIPPPSH